MTTNTLNNSTGFQFCLELPSGLPAPCSQAGQPSVSPVSLVFIRLLSWAEGLVSCLFSLLIACTLLTNVLFTEPFMVE